MTKPNTDKQTGEGKKSYLPIGILPFKVRFHIAKELIRVAFGVCLGDEWTNNIATDKDVKICMKLRKFDEN